MSTAVMARETRRHHHRRPVWGRHAPTVNVPQPKTVEAEPIAIDPHDESWRPFPYYGERPDDRPTLTGLTKSKVAAIFGRRK